MSTYWYHECLDHDPPLSSDEEFTQHTDDEAFRQGVALIAQRPMHEDGPILPLSVDGYFAWHAWRFLRKHPTCRIGLINEYGERRSASGGPEPLEGT